jgi:oxygen-independent coproporphyrinogen-3 oxidase
VAGIYVHIPFCKRACHYCNFHFSTSLRNKNELVDALLKEIELQAEYLSGETVETVYFGGGTPSLLDHKELGSILEKINTVFRPGPARELTLEANPDDIDQGKLNLWKDLGFNRLSIGVQSFFDEDLKWMNRAHNASEARKSVEVAAASFPNISIDLIYGVPGLSDLRWQQNVDTAIDLGVPHLSCYALTVEAKTPLDKLIRLHQKEDVDSDLQSQQFLLLMDKAAVAGYEHYEISNFAKPGFRSLHNSSYWSGKKYLGIGPSAHSFDGRSRSWNISNNMKYTRSIFEGNLPADSERLSDVQKTNEYIMTSLRTIEGLDLGRLSTARKDDLLRLSEKYIERGFMRRVADTLVLTNSGKLMADGIASDLFFL